MVRGRWSAEPAGSRAPARGAPGLRSGPRPALAEIVAVPPGRERGTQLQGELHPAPEQSFRRSPRRVFTVQMAEAQTLCHHGWGPGTTTLAAARGAGERGAWRGVSSCDFRGRGAGGRGLLTSCPRPCVGPPVYAQTSGASPRGEGKGGGTWHPSQANEGWGSSPAPVSRPHPRIYRHVC